ncbi:SAM-dependent methyltransferase [Nostocales cyanobacterium HT-58-2]|nr:SAM-dependent methyltransferase [Nostocales cyanobacterium HT-58-2]
MATKSYIWNPTDYEQNSSAQQKFARDLIVKMGLQGNERVLDLGCGDGKVTAEIASFVSDGFVVGIDNSEAMINHARSRYPKNTFPNLEFRLANALQLPFNKEFTIVFSNSVLHWIQDHASVLHGISQSLCSGGKIFLQMGGRGCAINMLRVVEDITLSSKWRKYFIDFSFPYSFYGPEEYKDWLKDAGLEAKRVELISKDMTHSGLAGLAGWIRTTWFPYTQSVPQEMREQFITEIVETYVQDYPITEDGLTHLEMVRLEVEAEKL